MTLPSLAERSSLSKGLLSKIENTPDANPSMETLHKIAKAFDITIAEILEREKVQALRIIPEKKPHWLPALVESLKKDGRSLNDDYLQALYVLQHRKGDTALKPEQWKWLYDSIEMSFKKE